MTLFTDYHSRAGLNCQSVLADRSTKGAQQTLYWFLCVLLSHAFMVRLGGARLRALVPFCTSLLTLLVLPPLFSSKLVGLFLNQKESIMTNLHSYSWASARSFVDKIQITKSLSYKVFSIKPLNL